MELGYEPVAGYAPKISSVKPEQFHKEQNLGVQHGPEFDLLSDRQLETLFSREFTIAKENNRMAYQLNESLASHNTTMLTSATLPGTVQLTPSGKLIILMRDGQTTGGYPRILQMTERAISILSQKKFGDQVAFQLG
jgi:allophanate hydrolase subunit 2